MSRFLLCVFLAIVAAGAVAFRDWQCREMFPAANRAACMMWR